MGPRPLLWSRLMVLLRALVSRLLRFGNTLLMCIQFVLYLLVFGLVCDSLFALGPSNIIFRSHLTVGLLDITYLGCRNIIWVVGFTLRASPSTAFVVLSRASVSCYLRSGITLLTSI